MVKVIKGDLILTEDTFFNENVIVKGNIYGKDGKIYGISANNLSAWDISANNISAWDISAYDISAKGIDYYAVCWAYKNIKCKSIKGRRGNSKHFVLDGEIIIEDKPKICDKCGQEIKEEEK
jgi:hypothetical protein